MHSPQLANIEISCHPRFAYEIAVALRPMDELLVPLRALNLQKLAVTLTR